MVIMINTAFSPNRAPSFTSNQKSNAVKPVNTNLLATEMKTVKKPSSFMRSVRVGAMAFLSGAAALTGCVKDDIKPDPPVIKPIDTTVVVKPDTLKPPIVLSELETKFAAAAPDLFALNSTEALKNLKEDSVLLQDGGGYVSYKLIPSKTSKDTIVLEEVNYSSRLKPQGTLDAKFYIDKQSKNLAESVSSRLPGAPPATINILPKDDKGTTQIVQGVKYNLFKNIDSTATLRTNIKQNTSEIIKRIIRK